MSYETYNEAIASAEDKIAWALCQIIDDDAPMRWTRYRFAAHCIAKNKELMGWLTELQGGKPRPVLLALAERCGACSAGRTSRSALRVNSSGEDGSKVGA